MCFMRSTYLNFCFCHFLKFCSKIFHNISRPILYELFAPCNVYISQTIVKPSIASSLTSRSTIMAATPESPEKCWVGTSMADLYHGHGPWGFEIPPITASRYHAVLYQLPATLNRPPKPHFSSQRLHWDDDHVRMPFSPKNVFPVKDENGEESLKERWGIIQLALLQPINSSKELEAVISSYNTRLPSFLALHHFFEEILEEEETRQFFESLLPGIVTLALELPAILPGNLPLLKHGACRSISLSQLQIASLLANAFLCTFPWRKDSTVFLRGINFVRLFAAHSRPEREQAVAEKLKCVCHYFRRVLTAEPLGVVTFERKHFPKSQLPRWDECDNNLGNTRLHVSSTGVIEDDGDGLLQVDFANKDVGGGVLGFGCVQEEIRFIICPELIISRLFTEQLASTEALVVTGAERYSNYTGYGDSFLWEGNCQDSTPYDDSGRRRTTIVAIDATRFTKPKEQYKPSYILRELSKAFAGFHSRFEGELPAVATGNWGCGAYRGDPNLKFLIQLMACSAARRDMVYFTFGDSLLRDKIHEIYLFLATNQITITQLWRYLCRFAHANVKSEHLFSYIQQAHFDNKGQLCIKDFFCFNKKKSDKNSPSTSNSRHSSNKNVAPDVVDGINSNIEDFDEDTVVSSPTKSIESDGDPDIIESSQTEQKSKRSLPKGLQQFKSGATGKTEYLQKKREYSHEDIHHLFNVIDEDSEKPARTNEVVDNSSLLSSIDEFARNAKDDKAKHVREDEKMDFDEAMDSTNDNMKVSPASEINESTSTWSDSTPKRKITDYFVKIDKG